MRRLVFAVPFVVTSCGRPVTTEPARARSAAVPADALPPDANLAPHVLVDELRPLDTHKTLVGMCRAAHCNPPPPAGATPPPGPTTPVVRDVRELAREGTGSRVRIARGEDHGTRFDRRTRLVFVRPDASEVAECALVDWDIDEIECTTTLSPEQLAVDRVVHRVRVDPPAAGAPMPAGPRPVTAGVVLDVPDEDGTRTLRLDVGSDHGVSTAWQARIADGDRCRIVKVTARTTWCRVSSTTNVRANARVVLTPTLD